MWQKLALSVVMTGACFGVSINEMSLEEKIGQVLVVHFHGEEINDDAKALIQEMHVGGIIYYNWANGLKSPDQVKSLSGGLQNCAQETRLAIPLFIAVDQEGGIVARLTKGFTVFPGNKALGMTGKPELAEESAFAMGQELKAVGVNLNFAPVVDINSNPRNPVIGLRSFSSFPEAVVAYGRKALEGYRKAGMITSLKHFPGHGDVEIDSHLDLPVVNKSKEQLIRGELRPFAELASKADTIMTGHLLVPVLDPDHCATLSKKTIDFLRKKIGFQGVVITDSLVMQGVLKECGTIDEAAIQALNAGCDLLVLGGKQLVGNSKIELTVKDIRRVHRSLVEAVKTGRISEKRLHQSVERVLSLKNRLKKDECSFDHVKEHQELAQKIASLSLEVIKNKQLPPLAEKRVVVFAPQLIKEMVEKTSLVQLGRATSSFFFEKLNPSDADIQVMKEEALQADVIVFCSYNSWRNPAQASLIHSLLKQDKPGVLVVVRDPLDATLYPEADLIISTFGPTAPSIQAASECLK